MPAPAKSLLTSRKRASQLEHWFAEVRRPLPWRHRYDPYEVWVSEIMLQQTRMEVVLGYFERFVERYPDVASLAEAPIDEVLAAWSGLGYYRRARMLHSGAAVVMDRHDGVLPSDHRVLMKIPGIGRYTAGAIASIAFDRRAPIVDGNVMRVLSRLDGIDAPLPEAVRRVWQASEELVNEASSPRVLNQSMMELGALVCKPASPACDSCPVSDSCVAFRLGLTDVLPRKKDPGAVRHLAIPLYIIRDVTGSSVLMRAESGPLMTGMLHLPHGNSLLFPNAIPLDVQREPPRATFRHTVTNRRIEFSVHEASLSESSVGDGEEYRWIDPADLDAYPHPSYVRKALRLAAGRLAKSRNIK